MYTSNSENDMPNEGDNDQDDKMSNYESENKSDIAEDKNDSDAYLCVTLANVISL